MTKQNKRQVCCEKLLQWAYRDELPKGYRDGMTGQVPAISPMFRYANLGGPVDNWSKEPGFPIAMGTVPHPDAIALHNAVVRLDPVTILWPSGADAMLGPLMAYLTDGEAFAVRTLTVGVAGLITTHARLGNRPIWQVDFNVIRMIGRNRKSLIRKGRGRRSARLQGDVRLDVPASEILTARFEYFVWHSALSELARTLDLGEHQALPPMAPQRPWDTPDHRRIFSDATAMDARALSTGRASVLPVLPLRPQRERVLPQRPAAQHGPVEQIVPQKGGAASR